MIWLMTALMGLANAEPLNAVETSYRGATILQGDTEVWFNEVTDANYEQCDNCYSHFEGNTLYVGNSDIYDNTSHVNRPT